MLFNPTHERRLFQQIDQFRLAPASATDLTASLLRCLPPSCSAVTRARVDQLIKARAWTDAALALVGYELPGWQLRRLAYEDGEWLCSLSQRPQLPCELDDTADAHHEIAALAISNAFLEARRRTECKPRLPASPAARSTSNYVVCDNFY